MESRGGNMRGILKKPTTGVTFEEEQKLPPWATEMLATEKSAAARFAIVPYHSSEPNNSTSSKRVAIVNPSLTQQSHSLVEDEAGELVRNSQSENTIPVYNARWKDGLIDVYKKQIQQLSQAMADMQTGMQRGAVAERAELAEVSVAKQAMDAQRRMFDMYYDLSKRCDHLEDVSRRQAELITSLNEMMERREAQHRNEIDNIRREIHRSVARDESPEQSLHRQKHPDPRYAENYFYDRHASSAPTKQPPHFQPKPRRLPKLRNRRPNHLRTPHDLGYSDDLEDEEQEYDYMRDRIRTKNKLGTIEDKLIELKRMTENL